MLPGICPPWERRAFAHNTSTKASSRLGRAGASRLRRRQLCLLGHESLCNGITKKKDSGYRPVAVGETLRLLTAKRLLATVSEDAGHRFRGCDTISPPNAAEIRTTEDVKPSSTMAPETQQRRGAVPLDCGLGERFQPDRQVLLLA